MHPDYFFQLQKPAAAAKIPVLEAVAVEVSVAEVAVDDAPAVIEEPVVVFEDDGYSLPALPETLRNANASMPDDDVEDFDNDDGTFFIMFFLFYCVFRFYLS